MPSGSPGVDGVTGAMLENLHYDSLISVLRQPPTSVSDHAPLLVTCQLRRKRVGAKGLNRVGVFQPKYEAKVEEGIRLF